MILVILLILMLVIALWTLSSGVSAWRKVAEAPSMGLPEGLPSTATAGKVSVVAYALRDEENLAEYLDMLLSQDYPDMEVVMVCDASAEATAILSEKFENVSNLHITFIPPGSHNLSRRKLAQTIGIKGATGDVVVLTSTAVWPRSSRWLSTLVSPLSDRHCAAALGYVHPVLSDYQGASRWYRQFDYISDSSDWIAAALDGEPFRADGQNMAFRRHIFFDIKGYASTINLQDGDDDIFIEQVASYGPCVPVLDPESFMDTRWGDQTDRLHVDLKDRYAFTRRYLKNVPVRRRAFTSWAQWIVPLLALIVILGCMPRLMTQLAVWIPGMTAPATSAMDMFRDVNLALSLDPGEWATTPAAALAGLLAAAAIYLCMVFREIFLYRHAAERLEGIRLFWALPLFMLWRPIGNFLFRLNHHSTRKSHFTWQR